MGNPVLGTTESLELMTPDLLLKARERGYDQSRVVFFISTSVSAKDVLKLISNRFDLLPVNGLRERRKEESFGDLPWNKESRTTEVKTDFQTSLVKVIFQLPSGLNKESFVRDLVTKSLFARGGPGSPLYQVVREDNQLAYNAGAGSFHCIDGGYWCLTVRTSTKNVDQVEKILPSVLGVSQLWSEEWFNDIKEALKGNMEMRTISPLALVGCAVSETIDFGEPFDDEEYLNMISRVSHREAISWLEEIDFSKARTIVALGK